MSILETKNLHKNYGGVAAVDGVSLRFEPGQIFGIIGPNGSGKTTLTNLLSGILQSDKGEIIFAGAPTTNFQPHAIAALGVSRTFQEVRLFNQMTVLDNVLITLTERGVFRSLFDTHSQEELTRAENTLQIVGLLEKKVQLAGNLSYGQRKLLEIARVLANDAEVILFDEPFAGLFPEMVKTVVSVMKKLKQEGKAIVLIEHNMELIRELSDYLYVMDSGRVLAEGKPNEVLAQRKVIEAYLGE